MSYGHISIAVMVGLGSASYSKTDNQTDCIITDDETLGALVSVISTSLLHISMVREGELLN